MICDEPVSALDVSVQAQILNLLEDIKVRMGLTMVFIAHDLAVVKHVSDRVAVMYLGKLCESAPPDVLYQRPAHPYTEALIASIPEPGSDTRCPQDPRSAFQRRPPVTYQPAFGMPLSNSVPLREDRCAAEEPQMRQLAPGQFVACHFPLAEPVAGSSRPSVSRVPPPSVQAASAISACHRRYADVGLTDRLKIRCSVAGGGGAAAGLKYR